MDTKLFQNLGHQVHHTFEPSPLESFPAPSVDQVTMEFDQLEALCPETGGPDIYTVSITYQPDKKCIESKSLKFYFEGFRNRGMFAEALTEQIANEIDEAIDPKKLAVTLIQKARGSVTITCTKVIDNMPGDHQ